MTDAALSITQSSVESFTDRYLRKLGCEIMKNGDEWQVKVPEGVESEVISEDTELILEGRNSEVSDHEVPLHAESSFFQDLLQEAGTRAPLGKFQIGSEEEDIKIPDWLKKGEVEVVESDFTPYYDRTAVLVLFDVSIETVSEYQTEQLRAIAIDKQSENVLPELADEFLNLTSIDGPKVEIGAPNIEPSEVEKGVDVARPIVLDSVQPKIDEIHREASRAADSEVEEYRQMQEQRIEELEEKAASLSKKIDDLVDEIGETTEHGGRTEVLEERKELKTDLAEIESELANIRQRKDRGFPDKQRQIRERHSLEVEITPVSVTQVEYESGEADFEIRTGATSKTITLGYGSAVGITEEIDCSDCGRRLSKKRPVTAISDGLVCHECG